MTSPLQIIAEDLLKSVVIAQTKWERAGLATRLQVLTEAGRELSRRRKELQEGLYADGLSQKLADYYGRWLIQQSSAEHLSRYAEDMTRLHHVEDGGIEVMVRRADGVVLLIAPANSPTMTSAAIFSMLLPGNGLIARGPDQSKGLRFVAEEVIGGALERAGFSRDLVRVVTGRSRPILSQYMPRPEVNTVVFFGNSVAGKAVAERGHELGKKVVLELDGSDFMVVWKDADIDKAVESAEHAFDFSTQPCPIPKHLLVHEAVYPRFVRDLRARMPALSVTAEADPVHGNLVPVARPEGFFAAFEEVRPLGKVDGGGYRMDAQGRPDPEGNYVAPTLVELEAETVIDRSLKCFDDEIFFPLIPVVRFSGKDAAIRAEMSSIIDRSPFGLRASVWSEDPEVLRYFAQQLNAVGLLIFNDDHAQSPKYASPWGGPRRSGGPHGENHLFWEKTSHLQGVRCQGLSFQQAQSVLQGLGHAQLSSKLPAPAPTTPPTDRGFPSLELVEDHPPVRFHLEDGVATISLNRPEHHNAVNAEVKDLLLEFTAELASKEVDLRAVVVQGEGRSFCSGGDLKMLRGMTPEQARRFMSEAAWAFRRLNRLKCPVIARVQGYCMGGGFELLLHCDLVIADESAVFGLPEATIGLVTTAGSVDRLCRAIGEKRASELLLTGRRLPAMEALRLGLVQRVVSSGHLPAAVDEAVNAILSMPSAGVSATKQLLTARAEVADRSAFLAELESFEGLVGDLKSKGDLK